MSLTFPRTDVLTAVRFQDQTFKLQSRQEQSTLATGVVRGKDFGPALWVASYKTVTMRSDDGVAYEAILNSLDGVTRNFEAGDVRRQYPRQYANGVFNDTGSVASINTNNRAISLTGLDAGFVLSVGDYIQFTYNSARALHQVMETVTANGSGTTAEFEIRPFLRPGLTVATAVKLKTPKGLFTLLPNSISPVVSTGRLTTISFQAIQDTSVQS